jgi:hypothetical protein
MEPLEAGKPITLTWTGAVPNQVRPHAYGTLEREAPC